MHAFEHGAVMWDVARPRRTSRLAGVGMAGFRVRDLAPLRIVPHPAVTLFLDFGAGSPVLDDNRGQQRGSLVTGPGLGAGGAVRAWGQDLECIQVRLSPVIARAVLGSSTADLDGAAVPLDDMWGRGEASRLCERLADLSSWQERFALVDALLARRREAGPPVEPEVAQAWHRIVVSHGAVRVGSLAAEVGWSRKRLWSRFCSQLGLPPKQAGKLVRFDRAVHRLVAGEEAARVSADAGYADQSHLHRDVMAFTGSTPAKMVEEPFLTVDDIAWPPPGPPTSAVPPHAVTPAPPTWPKARLRASGEASGHL
ncbi:helix-turn-helix domain-containing protein [Streptomyces sp. NPDC001594]|uniref:AraC family transcriptional regulator n=1 Tax=Streptomyces sp. NPDC001594 TaxID=3364590 RepID=UPI0036C29833